MKKKSDQVDDAKRQGGGASEDTVGYANPPAATRFKPGQSGNPKGRPRGAKGRKATVTRVLLAKHKADTTGTGRLRCISTLELAVHRLKQLAAAGHQRAFRLHMKLARQYGESDPDRPVGYLIVPTVESLEQWNEMFGPDGWATRRNDT